MPWSVQYPVNFSPSGDTTSQAFKKHIEEIKKIYGYLNELNSSKLSASDLSSSLSGINTNLTTHINSSNPHPNYKPSVSFSDLTGTLSLSDTRLTGNLPMSRITGNLDASRISNLTSLVDSRIPADKGDGITDDDISGNGYVKFNNGLIIQWGVDLKDASGAWEHSVTFPIAFPSVCFSVAASCYLNDGGSTPKLWGDDDDNSFYINNWSKTGFNAISHVEDFGGTAISYVAIGK